MQEQEQAKTVDIDTSGPGAEIELPEEKDESVVDTESSKEEKTEQPSEDKTYENERETKLKETKTEADTSKKEDNELEQYSKDVKKRISKLTHKWREAERQREEALSYAEKMIIAKKKAEDKLSKLEPGYLKSTEDSITSGVQAAQAKLAAAREANDLAAEAEALTAISELGYKKAKLEETKIAQEEYNKKQVSKPEINLERREAARGTPDPKAELWAQNNSWFGQDTAMTYTAFDLHKKLTEEEGFDPSSDDYYAEIDKRIRLEFPHKFDTNTGKVEQTTKPVQTVAAATRSTKTGRRTISLTPSEVAIAKKLGVSLEDYAKQKKYMKEV